MSSSHKWRKSKTSGDQVVPDIDIDPKRETKKSTKSKDDRMSSRTNSSSTVTTTSSASLNDSRVSDNNGLRGMISSGHEKNHNISGYDEFWEERYSRILTHNIFSNNSNSNNNFNDCSNR